MRKELIDTSIKKLSVSLGGIRKPVADDDLWTLYSNEDFVGIIKHIKRSLHLDINLRIGFVANTRFSAPAWVQIPNSLPMYGSPAFERYRVVMHIKKDFLMECPFESIIYGIAHELCHILLYALRHELKDSEEATDLTAMMLGYRHFYRFGYEYSKIDNIRPVGYLSFEEIRYASAIMQRLER